MSFFKGKTVLVTGGAGFVGTHLCKSLFELGAKVISLDNYFTGSKKNHLPGIKYIEGHTRDIENKIGNKFGKIDLVYHLGEYSRVEKSFEDPIGLVWDLNTAGTFSVLEFCKARNCKIVYSGSSTKFATDDDGKNMSPYAWSKSANTELVKNFANWYGLDFAITYFYNVYGEGEISTGPYATIVGIFKEQYKKGIPLTLVKPGDQKRNFTYIKDIVSALILVGEKGKGDEYGIGSDEAYSVKELAEMFGNKIIWMPERRGNRSGAQVLSEKTKALGWSPSMSLKTYIENFKKDFSNNSKKENANIKSKILVFSTTFFPKEGLSEKAIRLLAEKVTDVEFHIVTTNIGTSEIANLPENIKVFRIGDGGNLDKIQLINKGLEKAKELAKENHYIFVWSIMSSYGTLPALVLKKKLNIPLLITLGDQKIPNFLSPKYLLFSIFTNGGDQISTNAVLEENISRTTNLKWLTSVNKNGDPFSNAFRFAYNMVFSEIYKK